MLPSAKAYVCEYTRIFYDVDCNEAPDPLILYVKLPGYYGMYYPGSNMLLINEDLDYAMRYAVQVHEYTHMVGDWAEAGWSRCESEEKARKVTALWQGVPYSDRWKFIYRCYAQDSSAPK